MAKSCPPRIKRSAPSGEEFVVSDHLAIFVDNEEIVDNIARDMENSGFTFLFPPDECPEHKPEYYAVSFCDPDNYVLEVYTEPKKK